MPRTRALLPSLALGLALLTAACGASPTATRAPSSSSGAPATAGAPASDGVPAASSALDCTAPATPTTAQTEGPYYKAGAPENGNLVTDGMTGTRLTLTGYVVDTSCAPIANAKVETWQADASGTYDNAGYTLRGWVLTDTTGRFTIETVVPGEYPGRTEHIHVKVTPQAGSTLTTQLYFPGTTANDGDGIYSPDLLLTITPDGDALAGSYTFVVAG